MPKEAARCVYERSAWFPSFIIASKNEMVAIIRENYGKYDGYDGNEWMTVELSQTAKLPALDRLNTSASRFEGGLLAWLEIPDGPGDLDAQVHC
jgi:hypothetical protein